LTATKNSSEGGCAPMQRIIAAKISATIHKFFLRTVP
jgi:hypothetical protein